MIKVSMSKWKKCFKHTTNASYSYSVHGRRYVPYLANLIRCNDVPSDLSLWSVACGVINNECTWSRNTMHQKKHENGASSDRFSNTALQSDKRTFRICVRTHLPYTSCLDNICCHWFLHQYIYDPMRCILSSLQVPLPPRNAFLQQ